MPSSSPDSRSRRGFDTRLRPSAARGALLLLVTIGLPGTALAEPDSAVSVSATAYATFGAVPTLNPSRPDIHDGTSNLLVDTGDREQSSVSETFHEIYQGVGESGTSLFEVDFRGSSNLSTKTLDVDMLAFDQKNASASHWTATGVAGHHQWLRFSGPTDPSGNYVISFTTRLGSVTGENRQPGGLTAIWKANLSTQLYAEPDELGFRVLSLATRVEFKQDCPSLADPPCWSIARYFEASGDVTVPGWNPVLRVSHHLWVRATSARANAPAASMEMNLPAGVGFTIFQPVPEPGGGVLGLSALLVLAALRRRSHS